jgi:hypothetical protein
MSDEAIIKIVQMVCVSALFGFAIWVFFGKE